MRWKSITCADAAPRHASDGHVIRVAARMRIEFRSRLIAAGAGINRASFARAPPSHVFITDHVVGHSLSYTRVRSNPNPAATRDSDMGTHASRLGTRVNPARRAYRGPRPCP
jgi:hypothetical protein